MNDHEDDASLSSKKDHHQLKSDVDSAHDQQQQANLRVNIGISKEGKIQTFDGSQHENQMMMKITSGQHHHIHDYGVRRRICQVCHKVFSSGKALGGHMRTHVVQQADKNSNNKLDPIDLNKKSQLLKVKRPNQRNPRDEHGARLIDFSTEKIQPKTFSRTNTDRHVTSLPCVVCGKTFTSKNALFGHMRCHPEREWRGIKPPNSNDNPTISCSPSSSSAAAAEPLQKSPCDDDRKCVDLDSSDVNRAVDLSGSLKSWTVRRNRGTTLALGCNSSEISSKDDVRDYDSTMKECARHLLILSRGLSSDGGLIEKRDPAGESVAGNNNLSEHTKFLDRADTLISKNERRVSDSLSGFRIDFSEDKRNIAHQLELKGSDESNNGSGFVSDDSVRELDRHQDSIPTVSINENEKRIRRVLDFDLNEEPPSEH